MARIKSLIILILVCLIGFYLFKNAETETPTLYLGTANSDTHSIKALTKLYNSKLGIISQDIYWEMGFPQEFSTQCLEERIIPFVYWTPSIKTDIAPMRLSGISDSSWDDYLLDWVRACKSYEYPLFICFGPFDSKSGERDSFREAYHYIIDFFEEEGALNVFWVFGYTEPLTLTLFDTLYPGDDKIDAHLIVSRQLPPPFPEFSGKKPVFLALDAVIFSNLNHTEFASDYIINSLPQEVKFVFLPPYSSDSDRYHMMSNHSKFGANIDYVSDILIQ